MDYNQVSDRKNVLVTGGAGFLGSHLCEALLEKYNVICIDNYSTGSEENIHQLLADPRFAFVRHDLTQPLTEEVFRGVDRFRVSFIGVHEVYHLACPSAPQFYLRNGVETLSAAALATKHVLDFATKYRAKVVFASDVDIYGELTAGNEAPDEEYFGRLHYLMPLYAYANGKRFGESLVEAYRATYSLDARVVRLGEVYGPRMRWDDGRLIPTVISSALQQEVFRIPTKMPATAYCYVTDAIDAMEKVMHIDEGAHHIFNVGHNVTYTPQEIIQKVEHISGVAVRTEMIDTVDPLSREATWIEHSAIPNIYRLKEELAWFPVVLLDDGLRSTHDYMKSMQNIRRFL